MADETTRDDLRRELELRDERIKELRAEVDELRFLLRKAEEEVRADLEHVLENWVHTFGMEVGEDGTYSFGAWVKQRDEWFEKYRALLHKWNQLVPEYNAVVLPRRKVGRPLDASETQCQDVLKRRKAGQSLRTIADETNLGFQTVRTIIAKHSGTDRTSKRELERIELKRDVIRQYQARKQSLDALPRRVKHAIEAGEEFLKEARGLAKRR
jgi:hypothetical protein